MTEARPTFLDYLQQLQAAGQTHIYLDDAARSDLRALYQRVHITSADRPAAEKPAAQPEVVAQAPAVVSRVTSPQSGTAGERIAALASQAAHWAPAQQLGTLRQQCVFSSGNAAAEVAFIGPYPSFADERDKQPFSAEAGNKLDGILRAMGTSREAMYLTYLLKFRPAIVRQSTADRKATAEEFQVCEPFLSEELKIVQPKCLVALGPSVAQALLGTSARMSELRGKWHTYKGIPLRVTWHPAYLLLQERSNVQKREVWEDMLAVMEHQGMPISDKQRGYFAPKS